MRFRARVNEAAQRAAERRRREDEAPRLMARVPNLESLSLEISEQRGQGAASDSAYTRHVVLAHAPALFELPCREASCRDGGYDLTHGILQALGAGETRFEGEETCSGQTGTAECGRVLHYVGTATYK